MTKYMLDTNAIDKAMFSGKAQKIGQRTDIEVYITAMQAEEIAQIPDQNSLGEDLKEKRIRMFITILQMRIKLLPTAAVVGKARLGTCIYGNETMDRILNAINESIPGKDNTQDAIIGEAAIREGCILITEDIGFYNAMCKLSYPVMKWDSFILENGL